MQTPAFRSSVLKNSAHRCNAPGCRIPRSSISSYCIAHAADVRRYGEPNGRALKSSLWASQRKAVTDLVARNIEHAGLRLAVETIEGMKAQAVADSRAYPGAEEVQRLATHGVASKDILIELCAAFAYLRANPRAVRTDRGFDYALSAAVFKLAPRHRRVISRSTLVKPENRSYAPKARTSALGYLGQHLRITLSSLLAHVSVTIESLDDQRQKAEAKLTTPFLIL